MTELSRRSPVRPPATRDEVDAHRYRWRRLESALVRADPIPMDEQLRAQRRATVAGVLLGVLGLAAVAVYAAIVPRPDWIRQALVVGVPSGAVYAVAHDPDRLVPVPDAVAGRLVLAALGSPAGDAAPRLVPDDALAAAPRAPAPAVAGVPAVQTAAPLAARWAVCDELVRGRARSTTVLAGTLGAVAPAALYLSTPETGPFVVVDGVRHAVDAAGPDGPAVLAGLGLAGREPAVISAALASVVPEGPALRLPELPDGPGPRGVPGRPGDVLVTSTADGARRFLVVLPGAVQEVGVPLADALRAAGGRGPVEVTPAVLAEVPLGSAAGVAGWPATAPTWAEPAGAACWTWVDGRPGASVSASLPLAAHVTPVPLNGSGGGAVDAAAVGAGGPVRASSPTGGGTVWLVSGTGTCHGIADAETAAALGVPPDPSAAPEAVLRLLPQGGALDLGGVRAVLAPPA